MVSYAKILEIFDMDKPFPHFSPRPEPRAWRNNKMAGAMVLKPFHIVDKLREVSYKPHSTS